MRILDNYLYPVTIRTAEGVISLSSKGRYRSSDEPAPILRDIARTLLSSTFMEQVPKIGKDRLFLAAFVLGAFPHAVAGCDLWVKLVSTEAPAEVEAPAGSDLSPAHGFFGNFYSGPRALLVRIKSGLVQVTEEGRKEIQKGACSSLAGDQPAPRYASYRASLLDGALQATSGFLDEICLHNLFRRAHSCAWKVELDDLSCCAMVAENSGEKIAVDIDLTVLEDKSVAYQQLLGSLLEDPGDKADWDLEDI